jgi:hypothetical protein
MRFGIFLLLNIFTAFSAENPTTNLFQMSPAQFDRRADAKQEIRFDALQTNLLNAAVLHETNRRRAGQKLRPLKTHPKAVQVAFIQSHIMAKRGSISHDNPENPKFETLTKRIRSVGVNPGLAAENVATAFGLRYDSGKAFYKRKQRERTTFSYTPNGRAILPHTYESFAIPGGCVDELARPSEKHSARGCGVSRGVLHRLFCQIRNAHFLLHAGVPGSDSVAQRLTICSPVRTKASPQQNLPI